MKKLHTKSLTIRTEKIRELATVELEHVAGGATQLTCRCGTQPPTLCPGPSAACTGTTIH